MELNCNYITFDTPSYETTGSSPALLCLLPYQNRLTNDKMTTKLQAYETARSCGQPKNWTSAVGRMKGPFACI
jgi:hypothetical protein